MAMSGVGMCGLLVDIGVERTDPLRQLQVQYEKVFRELTECKKQNKHLIEYRRTLSQCVDNCVCDQKNNSKYWLKELEDQHKQVFAHSGLDFNWSVSVRTSADISKPDDKSDEKLQELEEEMTRLKEELAKSQELVANLQNSAAAAKEVPKERAQEYRVIHFNHNPVALELKKQKEDLKFLTEENERLKTRLELLENGYDANVTRQLDEGIKTGQQLKEYKEKLESSERQKKKIFDAFKQMSKEFREVCYRLLGFRIDLLKHQKYRLSNIYSDSPDDCLLFERDSNDTINLLENEYSKRLKDSEGMALYLTQHDSYPAFLASLTLDLFTKQTMI